MDVFSTCWNSSRHKDGGAVCDEIRELGFENIEVSHGFSLSLTPGLIKAVEEKRIRVIGVHNFCPAPIDVAADAPDAFPCTSHRKEDRERFMRLTTETMQVAATLGAKYVVLHMGEVHLFMGHKASRELQRLVRHGYAGTKEYALRKGELIRKRIKLAPIYFERARETLHQLTAKAKELDLVLGVEGRSNFEQVPGELEMPLLMQEFADDPHVRYWHDFGHIQRKHNLLLLNHNQYLANLKPHIYGAHINDVQWPQRDHRAPFYGGDVDFPNLLSRYFSPDMPLTWELSSSNTKEMILDAKARWDAMKRKIWGV